MLRCNVRVTLRRSHWHSSQMTSVSGLRCVCLNVVGGNCFRTSFLAFLCRLMVAARGVNHHVCWRVFIWQTWCKNNGGQAYNRNVHFTSLYPVVFYHCYCYYIVNAKNFDIIRVNLIIPTWVSASPFIFLIFFFHFYLCILCAKQVK